MPDQLFCLIRKRCVAATPEELVRQSLITYLIDDLQFPKLLLVMEKPLTPNGAIKPPLRRVDLLAYAKKESSGELYPLLLIECKADGFSTKAQRQLMGYNHFIRAPFVALAHRGGIYLRWFDHATESIRSTNHLFSYAGFCEIAEQNNKFLVKKNFNRLQTH